MDAELTESQRKLQEQLDLLAEKDAAEAARRRASGDSERAAGVSAEERLLGARGYMEEADEEPVFDKTPTRPPAKDFSDKVEPDLFQQGDKK